jgi:hypothetical protein
VKLRFCDDLGPDGIGWIADDLSTRTSHALAANGKVWFVDALDWEEGLERALALGEPAGVIQLLDRHDRDCAAVAQRLGVPHYFVPASAAGSPFTFVPVVRWRHWRECALWWPDTKTLVLADALGTNPFNTAGKAPLGVHLLLRLTPPRRLARLEPARILVGHGEGVHEAAAPALRQALATSRRGLPGLLLRLPLAGRSQREV